MVKVDFFLTNSKCRSIQWLKAFQLGVEKYSTLSATQVLHSPRIIYSQFSSKVSLFRLFEVLSLFEYPEGLYITLQVLETLETIFYYTL